MKKTLPFLLLLLSVGCLFAKDKDNKDTDKKEFNRLYVGVSGTPDAGFRIVNKNFVPAGVSESQVVGVVNYANKNDFPQIGFSAGLKGGVYVTHWLAVETGLQYSMYRYAYKSDLYHNYDIYNGTSNSSGSFRTTERNIYQYMRVPLSLNFSMGKRRVRGILSLGVDFDFLLKRKIDYTYTDVNGQATETQTVDKKDLRNYNLSPFLGIGADFYITHSLVLRLMPIAEIQGLKNINTPVTEYLWNVGVNVSFLIGFLKAGG